MKEELERDQQNPESGLNDKVVFKIASLKMQEKLKIFKIVWRDSHTEKIVFYHIHLNIKMM